MVPSILLILFIMGTCHINATEVAILEKILNNFQDYLIIFHYYNKHLEVLELLVKLKNWTIQLINYSGNVNISKLVQHNRLLHAIFLEEDGTLKENKIIDDVGKAEIVMIVNSGFIDTDQQTAMCKNNIFQKVRTVFIMGLDGTFLSYCCFYCNLEGISVKPIKSKGEEIPDLNTFINNHMNFGGYTFKLGYIHNPPIFFRGFEKGSEFILLNTISQLLNFKYNLTEYNGTDISGAPSIMINEIGLGNLDWAMGGLSQSLMRTMNKHIEFTRYIQFEGYHVGYQTHEDEFLLVFDLLNFLYISNWRSFLLLIGSIFAIVLVTRVSLKFVNHNVYTSLGELSVMLLPYLVEQQSTKLKRYIVTWKPYVKLLFIIWMFACIYLITTMKSMQTYFLMSSQTGPTDLNDLIKRGFELQIENDDFSNIEHHCLYSTSKFCCKELNKLHVLWGTDCRFMTYILNNQYGFIQEEASLKYMVLRECNLTMTQKQNIRFLPADIISKEWHAWAVKRGWPFIRALSRIISRTEASGLLKYWQTRNLRVAGNFYPDAKSHLRKERRNMKTSDLLYPLVILAAGYTISIITFLKELYDFKYNHVKT